MLLTTSSEWNDGRNTAAIPSSTEEKGSKLLNRRARPMARDRMENKERGGVKNCKQANLGLKDLVSWSSGFGLV